MNGLKEKRRWLKLVLDRAERILRKRAERNLKNKNQCTKCTIGRNKDGLQDIVNGVVVN